MPNTDQQKLLYYLLYEEQERKRLETIAPVYRPLLKDYKRFNVWYGGASSGKSYGVTQRDIHRCITEPGRNYVILRKIDKTVKTSTFAEAKKVINSWNLQDEFKINKTDQHIICKRNGNNMLFKGMDDPEKIKSITFDNGPVTDIRFEEATEFTYEDYKQCRLRLRGEWHRPKQMTLVFNPISSLHWAKREFFDIPKSRERCTILKTTYKDNPFLTKEDIEDLEDFKKDPVYWKVYGLGEWGVLGNLVFNNYVIENFDYKIYQYKNACYGMDFGFNHASTLIPAGFIDGELYIWNEEYVTKHTNGEFIEVIDKSEWFDKENRITAESAEPDRIKEWKQAGYKISPAKKGKGSLKRGIDFLKNIKIHIHRTKAPNTAREFQLFKYREDKDGNPTDDVLEVFDDCIAGLRYATEWLATMNYMNIGNKTKEMLKKRQKEIIRRDEEAFIF